MKAIQFSEARIGDGVQQGKEKLCPVQYITPIGDRILLSGFTDAGKVELLGRPTDLVGLFHRPWPEGKTEQDMRRRVWTQVDHLEAGVVASFDKLRDAIEEYELGKPLPEAEPVKK